MKQLTGTLAKIFIGQTMSLLTSSIVQYAIIWYITFQTGSAVELAIATIAGILPQVLLGPIAGVIADRVSRKKIMIISDTSIALATLILGILFIIGEPSLIGMYIILAIRSIGSTFHSPSFQASIPLLVPEEQLVRVSGINQTINSITLILAPIIAGALFGVIELQYIIFLDIIGAVFGVASIALVKIPKIERKEEKTHFIKEMKEGLIEIKKSKFLFVLIAFVIMISILFMPVSSMYPLITTTYFHLEAIHISIIEVVFSVGMLIGGVVMSIWGGFRKKQYTILISILLLSIILTLSGMVPAHMFWLFAVLTFAMGTTAPFFNGILIALLQIKIEPEKLGRVMSIVMSLMTAAAPIGLLIVSPIAEQIGVEKIFIMIGVLMTIVTLVTMNLKVMKEEE